ncbi:hypothetical protein [Phenylobacterium sp.]|uniref:hypothetical protein n=1 Tax=Phenylobacterium sp. TaxID=1871053 RepID=UPI003983508A
MAALPERKIEIVRTLVETAPDKVVAGLHAALADTGADSALGSVRRLVETEVRDRRLRNMVLQPIAPMCVGDGSDPRCLIFPARALGLIWRGLKATAADEVAEAALALTDFRPDDSSPEPFDTLSQIVAYGVRHGQVSEFVQAAELCDRARPGGAEQLAACLDLGAVVRRATLRLPEWIAHSGEETTASARLAYKDAVALADDAGPRFFEMLTAQMAHPWMVLRVISAVMDKPTERYLADSEMAGFGERVMQEIDDALHAIGHLDLDGGPAAAVAAGKLVEGVTLKTAEIEDCVDLGPEHGWGGRIAKHKKTLASVVEARLRDADKYATQALPTQAAKLARIRRTVPRLTVPPDEKTVSRALMLLTFAQEIRSSANYGGFAAVRGKMLEKLGDLLDHYVEEVLDYLKTGDVEDEAIAQAFLGVAAQFALLVRGEKAADLVRRRAAAAGHPDLPMAAHG